MNALVGLIVWLLGFVLITFALVKAFGWLMLLVSAGFIMMHIGEAIAESD